MKHFSFTRHPSAELIRLIAVKLGHPPDDYVWHMPEDRSLVSANKPIFAVADGVTLRTYPADAHANPSGAAEAARLFCENVVRSAELGYESLDAAHLPELFRAANDSINAFNASQGLSEATINYWDKDLYSATGAFAIVRDDELLWGTICDSYVVLYGPDGATKFRSPSCYGFDVIKIPNWEKLTEKQRYITRRKLARNGLNDQNKPIGYGVASGQPNAEHYFHSGSLVIETGDILLVLTDGFEHYLDSTEFLAIFKDWPANIEQRLDELREQYLTKDPSKYGREATLIAARDF